MTAPNLRACPHCQREGFRLASLERVDTLAPIALTGDPDSGYTADWEGKSTVNWSSSTTVFYVCLECRRELPEDYAALIDQLLGVFRETGGEA